MADRVNSSQSKKGKPPSLQPYTFNSFHYERFFKLKASNPRQYVPLKFELTISSPGLQLSTKSDNKMASLDLGRRPADTLPGLSWIVILW